MDFNGAFDRYLDLQVDEYYDDAEPEETEREYLNRAVPRLTPAQIAAQDAWLAALPMSERLALAACVSREDA